MVGENNLANIFTEISNDWPSYVEYCQSADRPNIFNIKSDHDFHSLFISQLRKKFETLVDLKKYTVKSSVGEGHLAGIPWLCVLDRSITDKTTEGFYIVYLFSRNAKKVFLSIGIGAGQFIEVYGDNKLAINKIGNAKNVFQKNFENYAPEVNFSTIDLLDGKDKNFIRPFTPRMMSRLHTYEAGCFFSKEYDLRNKTPEDMYLNDFSKYLVAYQKIVNDPKSSALIDVLAESVHDKIDTKSDLNVDYEIPTFPPLKLQKNKKKSPATKSATNKPARFSTSSKKVGDAGESHVYAYECNKLNKIGRGDLVSGIIKQYEDYSYFPGYDIKSFDENGNEIFIEVKSTGGKKKDHFEITDNEWRAAENYKDKYFVYLVHNALINPRITAKIQNPFKYVKQNIITLDPLVYKVSFNID